MNFQLRVSISPSFPLFSVDPNKKLGHFSTIPLFACPPQKRESTIYRHFVGRLDCCFRAEEGSRSACCLAPSPQSFLAALFCQTPWGSAREFIPFLVSGLSNLAPPHGGRAYFCRSKDSSMSPLTVKENCQGHCCTSLCTGKRATGKVIFSRMQMSPILEGSER